MGALYIKASEIKQESMASKIKMRTLCVMSRLEEVGMETFSLGFLDGDWIIGLLSFTSIKLKRGKPVIWLQDPAYDKHALSLESFRTELHVL